MSISDSDWKRYQDLHQLALDRFCQGVLDNAQTFQTLTREPGC
jgi:hypothetical protein